MKYYRLSKYNPKYRNPAGHYMIDEWTSFSDINSKINGKVITKEEYVQIENEMVYILSGVFLAFQPKKLTVNSLEIRDLEIDYDDISKELLGRISEGLVIDNIDDFKDIIRLVLRENIWCKFIAKGFFIHFGYDYYAYVGISERKKYFQIEQFKTENIFIEAYKSPYL